MDEHESLPRKTETKVLILFEPPGVGKGTQAGRLATTLGIPHISTGNILRDHVSCNTELGRRVKQTLEDGGLVPDDLMCALISLRIDESDCRLGFILDGFPRTEKQARFLDTELQDIAIQNRTECLETLAICIAVKVEELLRRVCGRRLCPVCGSIFNVHTSPPRIEGSCDFDGAELVVRADDLEETVLRRFNVYQEMTQGLVGYYQSSNRLQAVNGDLPVYVVTQTIINLLENNDHYV
jgi:adenylate kinase